MGKITKTEYGKTGRNGPAKKSSHGSEREKRKPNSPIVLRKQRAKAAANFGKDADFRRDIYGIVDEA